MNLSTALGLCSLTALAVSYKILVFSPATSKSHLISNGRIADELALAGHDVVLLEMDFMNVVNTTRTSSHARKLGVHGLNNERKELMELLRAEKFDAYFGEQVNICGFGLAYHLGIRHKFWISSCPMPAQSLQILGFDNPTSYLPIEVDLHPESSLLQRAENFMKHTAAVLASRVSNHYLTRRLREVFGENMPGVEELAASSDIVFVSTDELLDILTPTMANVVHIGGLGVNDSVVAFDETLTSEMYKGIKGVVLFTLGTIVKTTLIPPQIMKNVLQIAKSIPDYHFIIKIDKNHEEIRELAKEVKNVYVVDWLPQPSILAHPRLRMFITHAGYNGMIEAARNGVPLLTIPFMFDQPRNGRAVAAKGWGLTRTKEDLLNNPQKIQEAVEEILNNKKYRNTASKLKKLIRSRPISPSEKLVKTTEWVIENGGVPQIKTAGRSLHFVVYYNLDVITVFVVLPVTVIIMAITTIVNFLKRSSKVKIE